jgi:hypothetical protein
VVAPEAVRRGDVFLVVLQPTLQQDSKDEALSRHVGREIAATSRGSCYRPAANAAGSTLRVFHSRR